MNSIEMYRVGILSPGSQIEKPWEQTCLEDIAQDLEKGKLPGEFSNKIIETEEGSTKW